MRKFLILVALLSSGCTNKLYDMNKRINSYSYIPDVMAQGYMKAPAEFYKDGGGDCEDFANAKREAALAMGYSEDEIVFIYNHVTQTSAPHIRLQVDGWVLDSNTNAVKPANIIEGERVSYKKAVGIALVGNSAAYKKYLETNN